MLTGMPRPVPDLDSQPFWDGCAEDRLLVQRCDDCGATRWPPGPMCPACQSEQATWIEAGREGTIYSWTVVTHPVDAALVAQVPYVVALVDLPAGVRIVANVVGCDPERVVAGMAVRLVFEDQDGLRIPNFTPMEPA